ncbi:xanthine dehydrogenase family protein molybdopterin-binding subunit [Foetidibacter luteolus]|uniref:xanthine dehydrogenase family protein molybdopterin-binding subunit n=1 Tax=Foetidibacter luteolus TaxID=2608880 RepID=UPI00129A3EE1|nr:xanthine dehydrogenase family protein molybdopterin-binding subunit [Foetidibacter luteolus]
MQTTFTGKPVNRVDGPVKVTGRAQYAAEFSTGQTLHGVIISSTVARGRITGIDESAAMQVKGVVTIFSHKNIPTLAWLNFSYWDLAAPPGKHFRYFQTDEIYFSQQPVAIVIAETFEIARHAAALVHITYETLPAETDVYASLHKARKPKGSRIGIKKPKSRGNFSKAFAASAVTVKAEYRHGAEHHNPMETMASTVIYQDGGKLVIYDKTQGVFNSQQYIRGIFNLKFKNIKVVSPYVGGAFGVALRPQYQLFAAVLAALQLKRSVKISLTRQQMFSLGHRPAIVQQLALGASADGLLQAISHTAIQETSRFEDYVQAVVNWSGMLYNCAHVQMDYKLVPLDINSPADMRAPGAASGVFALECAMDELAYQLSIDPLQLRLINYAEKDGVSGKAYSSKALKACYLQGADKFGWQQRNPLPRSVKKGNKLVGMGMATGIWDALSIPVRAKAVLNAQGKLTVTSATADIGTGTYTIMSQIAAETLGLPLDDVTFQLGDTDFPLAFVQGGSYTAASVGAAVQKVCLEIKQDVFKLAKRIKNSPFKQCSLNDVVFSDGYIQLAGNRSTSLSLASVMQQSKTDRLKNTATALPNALQQMRYALNTHSAVFVEVEVDEDFGTIKVTRVVSAVAAGRILNPKTARSQVMGGVVWGISMALQEESVTDHHYGRYINHSFAEYHIPVNADISNIEIIFVEEQDDIVNPLGVKGVGEIGVVGVAAAVVNAIYHATGKRIRQLPVTLDKLL